MFLSYCRKHGLHEPSVIDLTRTGACPPPAQPWGPKGAAQTPLPSTPTLSLHRSLPPRPTVGRLPGPGGWPLTLRGCHRGCPWGWRWQWESQDVETEQIQRGGHPWADTAGRASRGSKACGQTRGGSAGRGLRRADRGQDPARGTRESPSSPLFYPPRTPPGPDRKLAPRPLSPPPPLAHRGVSQELCHLPGRTQRTTPSAFSCPPYPRRPSALPEALPRVCNKSLPRTWSFSPNTSLAGGGTVVAQSCPQTHLQGHWRRVGTLPVTQACLGLLSKGLGAAARRSPGCHSESEAGRWGREGAVTAEGPGGWSAKRIHLRAHFVPHTCLP